MADPMASEYEPHIRRASNLIEKARAAGRLDVIIDRRDLAWLRDRAKNYLDQLYDGVYNSDGEE